MIRYVVLVGLSGTGKSSVGRLAANELGWDLFDTDAEIERRTGRSIPDLFRIDGEAAFRVIEGQVLRDALEGNQRVIATGGGAVTDPAVWSPAFLGSTSTVVVWLDADTDTLIRRLRDQAMIDGPAAGRPLLSAGDLHLKLSSMRDRRANAYAHADVSLDVTDRTAQDVARDVAELVRFGNGEESRLTLRGERVQSAIHIGLGARFRIGSLIRERWPAAQHVWVIVDANVEPHIAPVIGTLRSSSPIPVHLLTVPSGEESKSLRELSRLYDWMFAGGVERGDVAVAMGGGMVGDLAGFAAASVLRGIGLVQMPTTLLSMVDSSVGGKTGINHPAGKNLIGAFNQPPEVVIDPDLLETLPPREGRAGWAEIIKHAVIEPSTPGGTPPVLLNLLGRNVPALTSFANPITPWVIRRNVSLKASVVEADEREAGIRALLNFGHTIGHGIEAAGYSQLHGEAVSAGICAALVIARDLDLIDTQFEQEVRNLLAAYGLPVRADVDPDTVREKMMADKKKSAGKQKWVLPHRSGGVKVTSDVPDEVVEHAILSVTGAG